MDFERGGFGFFFWFAFLLEVGGFFRFVGLGAIGGIVDILRDGWDLWGEWERRWESGTLVGRRGREGEYDGMGRDEDGMVYVYMIVQMSMNIRDSQTRKSESFLWEKKIIM